MSVGQFVRLIRLERARELLEATTLSIKEVMAEAGFNDKSYFTRKFEQAFGVPPSLYRSRFNIAIGIKGESQLAHLLQAAIRKTPRQPSSTVAKLSNR